jgi:AcrR family transcriptional regulator
MDDAAKPGSTAPGGPAPRAQPQQIRSRDKLGRILTAAAELLGELRYEELGTRLIAERAGVSVGTLYRFFPDKDSIVQTLLLGWLDDFTGRLDQAASAAGPVGVLLDWMVEEYAGYFRTEPGFRNAFYGAPRSPELQRAQRSTDHVIAARLCELLTTGDGPPDDGLRARCLVAIEVADHLVGLAFRDNSDGDRVVLGETKLLLRRYLGA